MLICAVLLTPTSHASTDWRAYAKTQAAKVGWTGAEWAALDEIVTPESGWDPCAVYPSRHACGYSGSSSCGIPQRQPCPPAWWGRLGSTGAAQVAELLRYVRQRYGDPLHALWFRQRTGWY